MISLHTARNWFTLQKIRFDLGASWMSIINFTLLIIATSDKLAKFVGVKHTKWFVPLTVFAVIFIIWLWGKVLYDVIKLPQRSEIETSSRSPVWNRLFEQLDRIEKKNDLR